MAQPAPSPLLRMPLERDEHGHSRFHGCSNIRDFELLGKLGEGTFGEVYKARSKRQSSVVALKKILMHNEKEGFPVTALREIKILKWLSHPNILQLREMAVEKKEGRRKASMYMVTPYMEHDLSGLLENPSVHFTEPQIKCYMLQLLEGVRYLHETKVLHRDMKAANILINNAGILQIADFGLARWYDEPPPRPGQGGGEGQRDYTPLVVTRWYRPPELLLNLRRYTTAVDMWGVGCIFGEMFKGKPILAGNSDINQAHLIFSLVGTPTEENMPGCTALEGFEIVKSFGNKPANLSQVFSEQGPLAVSLLSELLRLDWRKRVNAIDALKHPYFTSPPLPARPGELPRFEDSHEFDRRQFRGQRPKAPARAAGSTSFNSDGYPPTNLGPRAGFGQGNARIPGAARGPRLPPSSIVGGSRRLGDDGLPPRPPVMSHQSWSSHQNRRSDSRPDQRRDRHHPAWASGRVEGRVDTYVPRYDNPPRPPDDSAIMKNQNDRRNGTDASRYTGNRDDNRDSVSRRRSRSRSRSPVSRDKGRDDDSHYQLYRR